MLPYTATQTKVLTVNSVANDRSYGVVFRESNRFSLQLRKRKAILDI